MARILMQAYKTALVIVESRVPGIALACRQRDQRGVLATMGTHTRSSPPPSNFGDVRFDSQRLSPWPGGT